ncbi:MAG: nitrite reductase small subunit NirD [Rhodocyclaceae bacterium]|nr:nitrite reductase small subunit NirD [Rhodocyclaceae bacterium]
MSEWKAVCALEEIPRLGSRVVKTPQGEIALFRTAEDEVFALRDKCPHKGGPLSQGLVAGKVVTCPLHAWKIQFENGEAVAPDKGCAKPYPTKVEGGRVWIAI